MGLRARLVGQLLAVWRRSAPRFHLPGTSIVVRPHASDAPMRSLMAWRADWKTAAIAAILKHRRGAFIDVGTNAGQSLLDYAAAPVRSTYLGFEPNLTCAQQLSELIRANHLDRCRIIPAALSDNSGVGRLYLFGGDADPGASIDKALRPALGARPVSVALFRFDDLDGVLEEPDVALVKIDVEGAELSVLRGMAEMLRAKQPWIICEVLHRDAFAQPEPYQQRLDELMKLLVDIGFESHRLVQDPSGARIVDLVRIDAFPDRRWDDASARECDYLFVPQPEAAKARLVIGPEP